MKSSSSVIVEILRSILQDRFDACKRPESNGPTTLVRKLSQDLMDLANLTHNADLVRLALLAATSRAILESAIERRITIAFLETLTKERQTNPGRSLFLGGLVTVTFSDLFTQLGQLRLAEARKGFSALLGEGRELTDEAITVAARVADAVFEEFRRDIGTMLEDAIRGCEGDLTKATEHLHSILSKTMVRWHSLVTGLTFE